MLYSPIKMSSWMQQKEELTAVSHSFHFFTLPECSLWILVSHTFFTNRRLFIWFLMTLMSERTEKQRQHGEESKD